MAKLSRRLLAVYGADQLLANKNPRTVAKQLASVLVASRRQNQVELLADDIAWELEHRGKVSNAQVTSARALSDSLRREINRHIKKAVNVDEVILSEKIDGSLIGGVRIDTAGHSWDKSLRRELTQLQEEF